MASLLGSLRRRGRGMGGRRPRRFDPRVLHPPTARSSWREHERGSEKTGVARRAAARGPEAIKKPAPRLWCGLSFISSAISFAAFGDRRSGRWVL